MRKTLLRNAKTEAQRSMQRSETFWEAFERTAHRIRYFTVLEAHYNCLHQMEIDSMRPRPRILAVLTDRADAAHDMRISEEGNMATFAESARGAEMMARIWHEEGTDQPEEFMRSPPDGDWER